MGGYNPFHYFVVPSLFMSFLSISPLYTPSIHRSFVAHFIRIYPFTTLLSICNVDKFTLKREQIHKHNTIERKSVRNREKTNSSKYIKFLHFSTTQTHAPPAHASHKKPHTTILPICYLPLSLPLHTLFIHTHTK